MQTRPLRFLHHIEAIFQRHLDIQKQNVRLILQEQVDRLLAIFSLIYLVKPVRMEPDIFRHTTADYLFVICDQQLYRHFRSSSL